MVHFLLYSDFVSFIDKLFHSTLIRTVTCLATVNLVKEDLDNDEYFLVCFSSLRINSGLIPINRHFAKRHDAQFRRVCIFTVQVLLKKHGRTLYQENSE